MSLSPFQLPEGVTIPGKYQRTVNARKWFIEGAQDGYAGRVGSTDEEGQNGLRQHQGQSALTAYLDGYAAGKAARTKDTDR